jgi:small GTP-binding protein
MKRTVKIVVTGPFNAGKTAFIKAISEIDVVSTERKITNPLLAVKEETTVAMDFGRVALGDLVLHMFGTPGQKRFDFMWDILSQEMNGFIVLADSSTPETLDEVERILNLFQQYEGTVPYVVAANKQDVAGALKPEELRKALKIEQEILPCVATDRNSVKMVVQKLLNAVSELESQKERR